VPTRPIPRGAVHPVSLRRSPIESEMTVLVAISDASNAQSRPHRRRRRCSPIVGRSCATA
jgi:hypothetical protein